MDPWLRNIGVFWPSKVGTLFLNPYFIKKNCTTNKQTMKKSKTIGSTAVAVAVASEIKEEEIIFEEILPRLPIKSISIFKLVSKKWLNFITHNPLFPTHHSQKYPNTTTIPKSSLVVLMDLFTARLITILRYLFSTPSPNIQYSSLTRRITNQLL
ncbi:hypothetical protein Sjap_017320 [Stephania japonica]|uniref:F-box domain-containing protein n=1 Tax=Stephania japonica TaxID=461633 RepID=A0AAP0I618_9MAGN